MSMQCKAKRRAGFSLLELLVVVAILAIIGGGLLVAYDGLESQAAKGQAANTIAAVDQAVRTYTSVARSAPDNLDALVATANGDVTNGGDATTAELLGNMGSKLAGKLTLAALTADQVAALKGAGIDTLRYIDLAQNGESGSLGPISQADIPNRVFDEVVSGKNRGRGFAGALVENAVVAVWKAGSSFENNTKLGAAADDVLIAFGLGNNSTITQDDRTSVGNVSLSVAPSYGDVKKNEYGRYILLYNVGSATNPRSKAKLQAVVDARGDFLDEEIAEYTGQKQ